MLNLPLERLVSSWRKQGINLNNPADDLETWSTFNDCGRSPTADVLDLYRHLDGFADYEYCRNNWSLWSLAKIREVNLFNPTNDVWFADYLIDSYYFSFHTEDPQISSVYVGDDVSTYKVADTLTDFLEKLLSDPASVNVFPPTDEGPQSATFLLRLWRWWKPQA